MKKTIILYVFLSLFLLIMGGLLIFRTPLQSEPSLSDPVVAMADPGENSIEPPPKQTASDALFKPDLRIEDIPEGPLRTALMRCEPDIRAKALLKISALDVPENDYDSLRVHPNGGIFYICDFGGNMPKAHAQHRATKAATAVSSQASTTWSAAGPTNAPPIWESLPGATNTLYLDFDGHVVTNTAWNTYPDFNEPIWDCRPYDFNGNDSQFSVAEQNQMRVIWERVSEDYAPFDINVTTKEPNSWNRYTGHLLVTPEVDKNGVNCPHFGGGGVAFVDKFGTPEYSYDFNGECYSPAWVLNYEINGYAEFEAEATSHEMGHNLALSHDGQSGPGGAYYAGHENGNISWGPIMGAGYNKDVTQWSKGEYFKSNNKEDDLAIIDARLGYRPDDFGNDEFTAAALSVSSSGTVEQTGIIELALDTDVFSFTTASGMVEIAVLPYRDLNSGTWGGNSDILITLRDDLDGVIATNNPALETTASISTILDEGTYFISIETVGIGNPTKAGSPSGYTAYGSMGQYTLTGSVIPDPDIDGDGMPNDWELQFSGSVLGLVDSDDPDQDGFDNLSEYIAGTDPTNGASGFFLTQAIEPDGTNAQHFIVTWDSVENRLYDVLFSSNLMSEVFGPLQTDLPYPVNAYTDTVDQTEGFYKVEVRIAP